MPSQNETLWIVMPVYDEEESVGKVLDEWITTIRRLHIQFIFAAINDGSRDATLRVLREKASQNPEIKVFDKPNTGHGRTCFFGYREALKSGATWVLQIDSDGQCDAKYFPLFWKARKSHKVLMGLRYYRKDGWIRFLISRMVSVVLFLTWHIWVWDPNVPYRLMMSEILQESMHGIPETFSLGNILISAKLKKQNDIKWIPIVFRDRYGGSPSVKSGSFVKQGLLLYKQLVEERVTQNGKRPC